MTIIFMLFSVGLSVVVFILEGVIFIGILFCGVVFCGVGLVIIGVVSG